MGSMTMSMLNETSWLPPNPHDSLFNAELPQCASSQNTGTTTSTKGCQQSVERDKLLDQNKHESRQDRGHDRDAPELPKREHEQYATENARGKERSPRHQSNQGCKSGALPAEDANAPYSSKPYRQGFFKSPAGNKGAQILIGGTTNPLLEMRRESAPRPACRTATGIAQGNDKQAQVHKQPVRT